MPHSSVPAMTLAQPDLCIMLSNVQDWLQPALHGESTSACMCSNPRARQPFLRCCRRGLEATWLPETLAEQSALQVYIAGPGA